MPIYEYTCDDCGKDFDALVSSASAKNPCPHCGSKKVTKQFSTFAAHDGSSTPCKSGGCPSMSVPAGGGCGGGKCPFK